MKQGRGMTTKQQLWQRRKDFMRYIIRKQSVSSAFHSMNGDNLKARGTLYGKLTQRALELDFNRRTQWLPVLLSMDNGALLPEMLALAQEITQQGYAVFSMALDPEKAEATKGKGLKPNLNAAIGALRTMFEGLSVQLRIAQGAGVAMPSTGDINLTQNTLNILNITEEERKKFAEIGRTALRRIKENSAVGP